MRGRTAPDDPRGERGDIVLGWLTKLVLVFALLGLVGYDAVSLGLGRLQAEDRATAAARQAVAAYRDSTNVQQAYDAALAALEGSPADSVDPGSFSIGPDGSVTLTLQHEATTMLVEKVAPLRDWATSRTTVTAAPVR